MSEVAYDMIIAWPRLLTLQSARGRFFWKRKVHAWVLYRNCFDKSHKHGVGAGLTKIYQSQISIAENARVILVLQAPGHQLRAE